MTGNLRIKAERGTGMRKKRRSECGLWKLFFLVWVGMILTGCSSRGEILPEEMDSSSVETLQQSEVVDAQAKSQETVAELSEVTEIPAVADNPAETEIPAATEAPQKIFVDVCGAVASPGVYELDEGSRIFQAVDAAGGYLPEAASDYLNKARSLDDGQQIYVPTQEEVEAGPEEILAKRPEISDLTGNTAGDSAGEQNSRLSETEAGQGQLDDRINLNTADAALLSTLSGIGQSKAEAIIAYRQEHGGFASIEEIMNVEGIKEGTFSKIKDKISAG